MASLFPVEETKKEREEENTFVPVLFFLEEKTRRDFFSSFARPPPAPFFYYIHQNSKRSCDPVPSPPNRLYPSIGVVVVFITIRPKPKKPLNPLPLKPKTFVIPSTASITVIPVPFFSFFAGSKNSRACPVRPRPLRPFCSRKTKQRTRKRKAAFFESFRSAARPQRASYSSSSERQRYSSRDLSLVDFICLD